MTEMSNSQRMKELIKLFPHLKGFHSDLFDSIVDLNKQVHELIELINMISYYQSGYSILVQYIPQVLDLLTQIHEALPIEMNKAESLSTLIDLLIQISKPKSNLLKKKKFVTSIDTGIFGRDYVYDSTITYETIYYFDDIAFSQNLDSITTLFSIIGLEPHQNNKTGENQNIYFQKLYEYVENLLYIGDRVFPSTTFLSEPQIFKESAEIQKKIREIIKEIAFFTQNPKMKTLIKKSIQGFEILYEKNRDKPEKEIYFEGVIKSKKGMGEFKEFFSIFQTHLRSLNKKKNKEVKRVE